MIVEFARVDVDLADAAADVWRVLTDFGWPQVLAPTVMRCDLDGEGVGAVRTVHSSRGLTIREELLECDAARGRFRYRVLPSGDMPLAGIVSYECTVVVRPRDGGTRLSWRSAGTADGALPPITAFLAALYRNASANITAALAAG